MKFTLLQEGNLSKISRKGKNTYDITAYLIIFFLQLVSQSCFFAFNHIFKSRRICVAPHVDHTWRYSQYDQHSICQKYFIYLIYDKQNNQSKHTVWDSIYLTPCWYSPYTLSLEIYKEVNQTLSSPASS